MADVPRCALAEHAIAMEHACIIGRLDKQRAQHATT